MLQPKRNESLPPAHQCPSCHHPQTKIQRRLGETTRGSTIYVCTRKGECSVALDMAKVDTWVAV
jgi:hypothetical protein